MTSQGSHILHRLIVAALASLASAVPAGAAAPDDAMFRDKIAPIFEHSCIRCHNDTTRKGKLSLATLRDALAGGKHKVITPGDPDKSRLVEMISGGELAEMPDKGDKLTDAQVALISRWIKSGAHWPAGLVLRDKVKAASTWWSLQPLARPALPKLAGADARWARTPIDAFIIAKLHEKNLSPSSPADRRTLIRRLFYDLIGLPPTPQQVDAFVSDTDPEAYEKIVDALLASPHYGERWARHWLDVVHYGDTQGFDKDKLRPNAWPYRDYVIRAFNEDKPYGRFVKEQLAGDALYPDTRDGVVGLGFIATGPFDWVGQIEVRNGTMEKKRVRNLDRDDMVRTTMETFVSTTAGCARCHNHKFDPISQEDYYSLQAVFAAVDRADRPYDTDPHVAEQRAQLQQRLATLEKRKQSLDAKIAALAGPQLKAIDQRIAQLNNLKTGNKRPEYGYHSHVEKRQDVAKWVQVDLGKPVAIDHLIYIGCHDEFAGIGAGFGFPVRYRIEISDDAKFEHGVTSVADYTKADVANPGVNPQSVGVGGKTARYVRITATKLAPRTNDYIFALAELMVITAEGQNAASGATVTALDSIKAPVRWRRTNLVDGIYFGQNKKQVLDEIVKLNEQRRGILRRVVDDAMRKQIADADQSLKQTRQQLDALPKQGMVFAAAARFAPQGSFQPTNGSPRPVYLLHRGSEKNPGKLVQPGTISAVGWLPARFDLPAGHDESARRAALAQWIVDKRNPLTWRSIVNRVWLYHFGSGLVDSPNDFGRMGMEPTHAELLDWLAVWFRDHGQSIKSLHRLIVTSAVYRQSSSHSAKNAAIDGGNMYLWRQNRRRLEAEAIRDSVLLVAGKLDPKMGGPGFKAFGFKDDHSPHYKYQEHDPDDPASWRRSIYRFIVRSVPDPFMATLDCADPSLVVAKRNQTLTALQALALLNNKFMVRMSEHFAARVQAMARDLPGRIDAAYRLALGRAPTDEERQTLVAVAERHGLANVCRLIFNANEFVFVD